MKPDLPVRGPATAAVVAVAYVIAGKAGLSLAVANASVTAIWPPTGIALASILLGGPPAAAGVFVGAFVVNLSTAGLVWPSLAIALGNVLEGVVGAAVIRRRAGGAPGFGRARSLLLITGAAIPAAAAVSATVGVTALSWSGGAAAGALGSLWLTWWLGDLTGGVVFTPLLIAWAAPGPRPAGPAGRGEAVLFALAVVVTGTAIFTLVPPAGVIGAPLAFALLPVLTWAAFRLDLRATATAVAVFSCLAIGGTIAGRGPFAHAPADWPFLVLQSFMAVMGSTSLVMAALVGEQRGSLAALEDRRGFLEGRVVAQTEDLARTEAGSRRQAQVLQCILDSIAEGVMVVDRTGGFIQFNPGARRIWGLEDSGIPADQRDLGRLTRGRVFCADCATACPEDQLPLSRALRGESVDEEVYFLAGEGGSPGRWLGKSARPLRDGDGTLIGAVALVRDITAERQARETVQAKEVAEAANRAKSRFLATVSHELRTPLTAVIGYVNLLLGGRVESPAESRQYLERVLDNGRLLLDDIDDLLDLAKIEAGRTAVRIEPVELGAFLRDVTGRFEVQAGLRGVRLRLELPDAGPVVDSDPAKLRRILDNLIGNALKFTERGAVTVSAAAAGGGAVIRVADTGIGIPADKVGEVFDAFHQLDQGGPRRYGGVGLGLAICRSLAELLGARLTVESRDGIGSTFSLELPVRAPGAGSGMVAAGGESRAD